MKNACECCHAPTKATRAYQLLTVPGASIAFCEKHLATFKRFSGTIVDLKLLKEKPRELSKREAKDVQDVISKVLKEDLGDE